MRIAKVLTALAVLVAVFFIASCGLFIPQRGHENPLDPDSPLALVIDFTAETLTIDATAGTASIRLSWALPLEKAPASVVLVRKEGSEPSSIGDGTAIDIAAADLKYDDADVVPDKVYWYGAWCVTADEELTVGPIYASASTHIVAPLESLTAVGTASDTVELTWTLPETNTPAGVVIIRKADEAPLSMEDGVTVPAVLENEAFIDSVSDEAVYHYAAWTHDEGQLRYAGPVTAEASTVVPDAISDFGAVATSETEVQLTWTVPTTNPPASIRVVRKAGSTPLDASDGTDLTATLDSGTHLDGSLGAGTVYYYAAWGVNESGHIYSESVSDSANTTISLLKVYPSTDGDVYESTGIGYWTDTNLHLSDQSGYRRYALLDFDGAPPQALEAYLLLFHPQSPGYLTTVEQVTAAWDTTVDYATASSTLFVDPATAESITVAYGFNSWDVTSIAQAWASGSSANDGLRMRHDVGDTVYYYSNEHSSEYYRPYLWVLCSEEFH